MKRQLETSTTYFGTSGASLHGCVFKTFRFHIIAFSFSNTLVFLIFFIVSRYSVAFSNGNGSYNLGLRVHIDVLIN